MEISIEMPVFIVKLIAGQGCRDFKNARDLS